MFFYRRNPCKSRLINSQIYLTTRSELSANSKWQFVGYNTISVPKSRLYAYGVQFTEVSGLTEMPVKDVLTVDDPKGAAAIAGTADQIWLWDTANAKWRQYFYSSGRGSKVTGWCNSEDNTKITTDTMKNGDGFFFQRASSADGNITISGALKTTSADPITLAKSRLHFICNPWPVEINIKDFESMISDPKGAAGIAGTADQIWMWDTTNATWKKYFYSSGRGSKVTGWCNEEDNTKITEDKIGVGQGFFIQRASSADGTLTFVKPTF